jgi:hypothetical protein
MAVLFLRLEDGNRNDLRKVENVAHLYTLPTPINTM